MAALVVAATVSAIPRTGPKSRPAARVKIVRGIGAIVMTVYARKNKIGAAVP